MPESYTLNQICGIFGFESKLDDSILRRLFIPNFENVEKIDDTILIKTLIFTGFSNHLRKHDRLEYFSHKSIHINSFGIPAISALNKLTMSVEKYFS
jgi:hypothetical protein